MTLSERCQNIVTTVTRRLFEATTTAMRPSVLSFDRHDKVASAAIAAAQSARVVVSLGYAKGWCRTTDLYLHGSRWRPGIVEQWPEFIRAGAAAGTDRERRRNRPDRPRNGEVFPPVPDVFPVSWETPSM